MSEISLPSATDSETAAYDPLDDLLVAQADRPKHLASVNLRTLAPFQRALLVIDGTVTKFLEAYFMEPVDVQVVAEEPRQLDSDHTWLSVKAGSTVVTRQVMLLGRHSRRFHAYALSLLVMERLPGHVQEALKINPGGIGRALSDQHMETRRDVLWYGREKLDAMPDPVRQRCDGRFLSRAYRIIRNGEPMMLINEKFPLDVEWTERD